MKRPMSMSRHVDEWIILSGQTGQNPGGENGIAEQTRQCLRNLAAVLDDAGASLADLVKVNIYLADIDDYDAMNAAYSELMPEPFPARTCVGVAALPGRALIEIEGWARPSAESTS